MSRTSRAVSRERVRRSCGHLEAVYLTGSGLRRIHEREREICGICLRRRAFSESPEGKTEERRPPSERDSSGEVAVVLKKRHRSGENDTTEGGAE